MFSANGQKVSLGAEVIDEISKRLKISKSTVEEAKEIFSKALKDENLKKRNCSDLAKASLYLACRAQNEPVPFNSIGGLCIEERRKVFRTYKSLKKTLNLSITPIDECDLLRSSVIELPEEVRGLAEEILKQSKDDRRSPQTKALASILLASSVHGHRISLKEMHEATGSNITIVRNAARDMAEELGLNPASEIIKGACIPTEVQEKAQSILSRTKGMVRKSEQALAAGAICLASELCGVSISFGEAAKLTGINAQSAKKAYYELKRIYESNNNE